MNTLKFLILILSVFFQGCIGQVNSNKEENVSDVALPVNKIDSLSHFKKQLEELKTYNTPYGDSLVLRKFPKEWPMPSRYIETSKESKRLNKIQSFNYLEETKNKKALLISNLEINNHVITFNDSKPYYIEREEMSWFTRFRGLKLKILDSIDVISLDISGDINCNNCEYGLSQELNILLTAKGQRIIDRLIISSIYGNDLGRDMVFFYIDANNIIHLKNFGHDELKEYYDWHEKYTITDKGKFVRYYYKNGIYKTLRESGNIVNHVRDGKWIEKKNNHFINKYAYLEAEYNKGEPIGDFSFYILDYKIDKITGLPIWNTATKGKLFYTEVYENGEMIKREFVE